LISRAGSRSEPRVSTSCWLKHSFLWKLYIQIGDHVLLRPFEASQGVSEQSFVHKVTTLFTTLQAESFARVDRVVIHSRSYSWDLHRGEAHLPMYTLHSHLRAYIPTRTKLRGKMSVKGREPSASHFPARVIRVNHREREIPHRGDVSFRLETIICVYFANFCFLHWKKKLATAAN